MLDLVSVFTSGGLVLWSKQFGHVNAHKESPVDSLIRHVLIEGRVNLDEYYIGSHSLKWSFANDLGLVFVVRCFKDFATPIVGITLFALE